MHHPQTDNGRKRWARGLLIAAVLLALAAAGCNTMRGIGKDIEQAGEAIQKSTK